MKKYIKTIAVIAASALMLPACDVMETNSPDINENKGGTNELSFALAANETRSSSSEEMDPFTSTTTIPIGTDEEGNAYYLEESVVDLSTPVTRGTPAYTENVIKLYKGMMAVHSELSGAGAETYEYNGEYYSKSYKGIYPNIWDKGKIVGTGENQTKQLSFYMYMPTDMTGDKKPVSGITYGETTVNNVAHQTIAFDYTSPEHASDQQDILFSARRVTEVEYNNKNKVADVLFHHALTGVKFSTANVISGNVDGTKTYITKITFKGLKDKGHCVVTPTSEKGKYVDDRDVFSSSQDGVVVWSAPTEGNATGNNAKGISQTFDENNYAANIYSEKTDFNNFPESFSKEDKNFGEPGHKTTDWNINDKNASLTFWLIPQTLNDVELEIEFYIDAGGKKSQTFTQRVRGFNNGVEWKAGQLRTYVLKATQVAVHVEDELTDDNTKEKVVIRNTGNVPEWVRATVVAYWADANGNAVYGYESATSSNYVPAWDLATEISSNPVYGKFSSSVNGTVTEGKFPGDGWVKGNDGYYYFNDIIGVDKAATTPIFSKYVVGTVPAIYQINRNTFAKEAVSGVHLEMKIVVQAILAKATSTKDNDGNYTYTKDEDYTDAWARTAAPSSTSSN